MIYSYYGVFVEEIRLINSDGGIFVINLCFYIVEGKFILKILNDLLKSNIFVVYLFYFRISEK